MTGATAFRTSGGDRLELLATGTGTPVTVFAHGLGGSIATTRPFASGVSGTKLFPHARGHGGSSRGPMTYAGLAADLAEIAGAYEATRALGVSMGAGTLLRLAAAEPRRFERLVLVIPAVVDGPRDAGTAAYWRRVWAAAPEELARMLAAEIPAEAREAAAAWIDEQVRTYTNRRSRRLFMELAADRPVEDEAVLKEVDTPVLVIGQEGDPRHPADVARRLAELLPRAELHVYEEPGLLWRYRADLRARIGGFLNG